MQVNQEVLYDIFDPLNQTSLTHFYGIAHGSYRDTGGVLCYFRWFGISDSGLEGCFNGVRVSIVRILLRVVVYIGKI